MKSTKLIKIGYLVVLTILGLPIGASAQVVINSDIVNAPGTYAYIAKPDLTPVASGTIDFFWFNTSDEATISTWTTAANWTASSLFANKLGSQSIGVGYDGAPGLFSGPVDILSLATGAVGKSFAAAVTSGSLLGVFKFVDNLPANTPAPNPASPVAALLPDVGTSGILVGSFDADGSFDYGGSPIAAEAYILVPEPASGSLILLTGGMLVALRRLQKKGVSL
jgi:hypothetical protein